MSSLNGLKLHGISALPLNFQHPNFFFQLGNANMNVKVVVREGYEEEMKSRNREGGELRKKPCYNQTCM